MGKFSREKGRRGEQEVARLIPGAKRTGVCGAKTYCDVTWPSGVAQVKNTSAIGGAAITDNLEKLAEEAPKKHHYLIFKSKRGVWVICQRLDQWLQEEVS